MTIQISTSLAFYEAGGREKLRRENRCRMCLEPRRRRGAHKLTRHHIVPQAWEGWDQFGFKRYMVRDADANLVPLCVRCHREVESDDGARYMLRKVLGQCEIAFAIRVAGRAWFDKRYPARLNRDARLELAA